MDRIITLFPKQFSCTSLVCRRISLLLLLIIPAIFSTNLVNAQASSYSFTASSGTYTPITGGTQLSTTILDSWVSTAIPLSPAFTFAGVSYTTAFVTSNGLITLGGAAPSNIQYNGIANTTGSGIAICPFNADLEASAATGAASEIRFETVGNEHVFQWTDATRYAYGDRFNIQTRLNASTGVIVFVYGGAVTAGTNTGRQPIVGIRTSATDYRTFTVGTGNETWAAPLSGATTTNNMRFTSTAPAKMPTAGQTYTLTPASCIVPSGLTMGSITATSASATFTSTSTSFIVEYGPTGFTPGTGATAGTGGMIVTGASSPITLSGLSQNTTYDVYVRTNCSSAGNGYSINSFSATFTTLEACPSPTALAVGSITSTTATATFTSSGGAFIVEYGPLNFIPGTGATAGTGGTIITSTSSPVNLSGLTPSTDYDVYVRRNCTSTGDGYSLNSAKVKFTTLCQPPSVLTTTPGLRCGPGTVVLGATASASGQLNWYNAATGATVLGTGASFTTPTITTTTPFYVSASSNNFNYQNYTVGYITSANYSFLTQTVGWGSMFTVNANCTFDSVGVYPTGTGTITIKILDPSNNVLFTGPTVNITGTGTQKIMVPVGASLLPGNYKLGMSSTGVTNLGSQATGGSFAYPFVSPPLTITSGTQGSGAVAAVYYWFYDWRITTATGCESARTLVTATINPKPDTTVTVTGATSFCPGRSVIFNAATTTGLTYQWLLNNNVIPSATAASYTATAAGSYRVRVANSTCSDTSNARVVTILPAPTATVTAGGSTTFCSTDSVLLTGPAPVTGITYQWLRNGTAIAGATASTLYAKTTGGYRLALSNSTCTDTSATTTITVNPVPVIAVSPATAAAVCAGTSITLTASGAATYSWSPAAGLNTTTGATVIATPAGTTTYTVTGTAANGCVATATKLVTVSAAPTVTISPATASVCIGRSTTLTASGAATYSWSPATGLSATTGASVTASPTVPTTYTVVGDDGIGCTGTATRTVTVNPLPTIAITPSTATTVCEGVSTLLTASGGISYSWSPATGLSGTTGTSVLATPTTTTTYTVTGTNANGCQNTATKLITINAAPVINVTPATAAICAGSSVVLNASGATTYSWSPSATLSAATGATVTATPTATTTYNITGTGANGCSRTVAKVVTVTQIPVVSVTPAGATSICTGSTVSLTASGATAYSWSPGTGLSSTTNPTVLAFPTVTTTYTITGNTNGCIGTTTKTITVNPLPVATATATGPVAFCEGGNVVIVANSGTGLTYQWRRNGVAIAGETSSSYTATQSGFYSVVVSNGLCTATSTVVNVTVSTLPVAVITPLGAPSFCQGGNVLLQATQGVGYTYQWQLNGNDIPGATAASYTAGTTGSYTVRITNGTCVVTSQVQAVSVAQGPDTTVVVSGALSFCQGGLVVLKARNGVGYTYQWYKNGVAIAGETGMSTIAATSGNYSVLVSDGTCNGMSSNYTVDVHNLPVAVITVTGGNQMSTSATYAAYQWYRNGFPIAGATTASYTALRDGFYSVVVADSIGCSATTPVVQIHSLDINNVGIASYNVKVYPNPAKDLVRIEADGIVDVKLSTIDGREVMSKAQAVSLDISALADGIYTIRISDHKTGALIKIDRLVKATR